MNPISSSDLLARLWYSLQQKKNPNYKRLLEFMPVYVRRAKYKIVTCDVSFPDYNSQPITFVVFYGTPEPPLPQPKPVAQPLPALLL